MSKIAKAVKLAEIADQHDTEELTPLFRKKDASIKSYISTAPLPRNYLINGSFPKGKVGALVGPGGVSKSQLALQIAAAVSSESEICEGTWSTGSAGQVVCIFAEEDEDEIHRRIYNLKKAYDGKTLKAIEKNLHVISVVAGDNLMTVKGMNKEVEATEYIDRILLALTEFKNLDLVVIDPVSRFRGGDENTAQDATRFIECIERIPKETGASVLLIHHANKSSAKPSAGGSMNQHMVRGSSAFVDGVRWVMAMQTFTEADAKSYRIDSQSCKSYVKVEVVKNNYGPPQSEAIILERSDGGLLIRSYIQTTKSQVRMNSEFNIPLVLNEELSKGNIYSETSFLNKYAGKKGQFQIGKDAMKNIIRQLIKDGKVKKVKTSPFERKANKNLTLKLTTVI